MALTLLHTDLPFPARRGKVRDVYDISSQTGSPTLLIIATDRISAFDCIMPNGIPGKGRLLTQLSNFWFVEQLSPLLQSAGDAAPGHHLIETDVERFPAFLQPHRAALQDRAVIARKTRVIPIECVARGYLAGSGWSEYRQSGHVCGVKLPTGLGQSERLPQPIFTPATKADTGHDQNITFEQATSAIGVELATRLREWTLRLYQHAADYAASRGIIIADTKFEFGLAEDGRLTLIDEALTPDSSRFWPVDGYAPGREQPSFDKQFVRNWLQQQPWDKTPPAPALPDDVVEGTRRRYNEAFERLTGRAAC